MKLIRILLADDHAVLRAGLKALLNAEPDMTVVGEAADGEACVRQATMLRPDIVLLDINMPRCNGLEALARLRAEAPESRVLVLTMHDDVGYLRQVLAAGGAGYVLKQAASEELLSAIRAVRDGGIYLHPRHTKALLEGTLDREHGRAAASDEKGGLALLSERERQVLRLVALGYRNSEIAEMLCLSVKTVETYKTRLMEKLGLRSRAALVRFALEAGVLEEG
ncbi:MAG: response regulator transcription factor [Anaerolineae bacterium]|nr:response regulator transcription factor [Caldilineales bacterium]MCX7853890.1 response regulator transcription factor [Caldilineales bacterium]MDW8268591.1 response regulator transcription factor [Anaerolineae bacterium]